MQLRQAQRVVLVGLAFEMLELPRLRRRVRDETTHAEFLAQIVDPARQQTCLDDDDTRLRAGKKRSQLFRGGIDGVEAKLAAVRIEKANNALVFAQIDGQNGGVHVQAPVGLWGLKRWYVHATTPHGLHGFFRPQSPLTW